MLEQLVLGIIQGVAEWLPVSSEGMIVLAKTYLFPSDASLSAMIEDALFLHIGTLLAACIYLRQDLIRLIDALFKYKKSPAETQVLFKFLLISTLISGVLGIGLLKLLEGFSEQFTAQTQFVVIFIGVLLLMTGLLQLKTKTTGLRKIKDLNLVDTFILGIAQGLAALPGFSRSGLTVAALLLKKFDKASALKISFLMSIPIVLAGNIIMNLDGFMFTPEKLVGLLASFISGFLSIHALILLAEKINFGKFVIFFGLLTILSAFI